MLLLLVKAISRLPLWFLYLVSDIFFFFVYHLFRYRRSVVRKNLTEAFPKKSQDEIVKIEKRFYHFFTDLIFETCKLCTISPTEIERRMIFPDILTINELLGSGKSVALYLGHFGNWEWVTSIGLWLHKDAVVAQIYHKLRNEAMNKTMINLRERMGNKCVDMYKTVRFIAEGMRSGQPHIIGFIADQSPKRREAKHFMPFLHHSVPVLTGTEKTIKHFGFEAFFVHMKRLKRGYYECRIERLHPEPQTLPDFELTRLYFQRLEKDITAYPELYLWTHNRFKYGYRT